MAAGTTSRRRKLVRYGTTARERAESIVYRLDEYLSVCASPASPATTRKTVRGFLVLALQIALEEAGTQSTALSLRDEYEAGPNVVRETAQQEKTAPCQKEHGLRKYSA
jgi:hypothetical protein